MTPLYKMPNALHNDQDTLRMFAGLMMSKEEMFDDIAFEFIHKVIEKRMEVAKMPVDRRLILFIADLAKGNPGRAMLYLQSLSAYMKDTGADTPDLSTFGMMFANGFPDDFSMDVAWDSQKVEGGNAVDNMVPEIWPTMGV